MTHFILTVYEFYYEVWDLVTSYICMSTLYFLLYSLMVAITVARTHNCWYSLQYMLCVNGLLFRVNMEVAAEHSWSLDVSSSSYSSIRKQFYSTLDCEAAEVSSWPHTHPSSPKVKNETSYTPLSLYIGIQFLKTKMETITLGQG